jgi:[acyl-carrier-protein] S-malonyltransferase
MSIAFIFPGQGSQTVGMGADLAQAFAAAREVFQEVDDALGQKLFELMSEVNTARLPPPARSPWPTPLAC